MASGALFGSTGRSQSKNLVEFRAGKMFMKGKMVHPDKRKGMVYVYQSDDALMHFCWKDRTNGTVEDVSIFDLSSYRISSVVCFLTPNFQINKFIIKCKCKSICRNNCHANNANVRLR